MAAARHRLALLVLVGLLLVGNHAWLYPNEDDLRYTYERKQIEVENGSLTYHGVEDTLFGGKYSDLNALGCQPPDADARTCAFDTYLASHGPVTRTAGNDLFDGPEFVHLADGYYRRVHRSNGSVRTYDVERVGPREFLAAVAVNLTGADPDDVSDLGVASTLAVTGGTTTSFEDIEDDELGEVYRRGDGYYTVVVTDQRSPDPPFPLPETLRLFASAVGFLALVVAGVQIAHRIEWTGT